MISIIADDEPLTREILREKLPWRELGFHAVLEAENGQQVLELISRNPVVDVIISDIRMPHMDGLELVSTIRKVNKHCQIIFISGYCEKEYLKKAIRLGAVDFLEKPISIPEIENSLINAVECIKLQAAKNEEHSPAMEEKQQNNPADFLKLFMEQPAKIWPELQKLLHQEIVEIYSLQTGNLSKQFITDMKYQAKEAGSDFIFSELLQYHCFLIIYSGEKSIYGLINDFVHNHQLYGGYGSCPISCQELYHTIYHALNAMSNHFF